MENLTHENFMIVAEAMLKITYNFWPVVVFCVGYAIYETYLLKGSRS